MALEIAIEYKEMSQLIMKRHLNHMESGGGVLHGLLKCDWEALPQIVNKQLADDFYEIISKILEINREVFCMCDENKMNPVHIILKLVFENQTVFATITAN